MLSFWSTIPCFNHTVRNIYIFWVHWVDLRYVLCLQAFEETELLRLVYFGGVDASLRKEVWPFLLGHYQFGMSDAERKKVCRFHDYGFATQTFPTSTPDPWSLIPHPSSLTPGGRTGQSVLPADHAWVARLWGDSPPAGEGAACGGISKVLYRSEHGQFQSEVDPPWLHRQQWGEAEANTFIQSYRLCTQKCLFTM